MTASEILNVCGTVVVIQAFCDLMAYWRIYSKAPYQRALEKRERALFRKERAVKEANEAKEAAAASASAAAASSSKSGSKKATSSGSSSGKVTRTAKALERAEQDLVDATSHVTYFSLTPSMMTALLFLIVMRVMGTENQGKIMGILPFVPYSFVYRITGRGLDFGSAVLETEDEKPDVRHVTQAFSFVFVYFLAGLSVKFYTNRLLGQKTPGRFSTVNLVSGVVSEYPALVSCTLPLVFSLALFLS
jgi:hypothetical protein